MPVACMIAIGHGRTDRGVRMHVTRFAATVLLALPLGGCFGVTLPSQPLPDWAMSPQAQSDEPRSDQASGARAKKQRIVRQRVPHDLSAADTALVTSGTGASVRPASRFEASKPFAPGWDAREDERDPSLRHTLNICRGC